MREALATHGLPRRVGWFLVRARLRARRTGDRFALVSSLPPGDLRRLIALAGAGEAVAELGTAHAWTATALALARPGRRVVTFDPERRAARERYLALVGDEVRARIDFVTAPGASGPRPVSLLYIDSSHEREETLAEVRAWQPLLAPGSLIVFDDYANPHFPGVAEAIAELGLDGVRHGRFYVHRV